jgi:hypothetical protein
MLHMFDHRIASGKYGKSPFLMGKNSLFLWSFSIAMFDITGG